jgi:hypothetical protein
LEGIGRELARSEPGGGRVVGTELDASQGDRQTQGVARFQEVAEQPGADDQGRDTDADEQMSESSSSFLLVEHH